MADLIIDVYQGSNRKCIAIGNHRISAGKAYGFLEKVESYRCDANDILSCIGNVNRWIPCSERLPDEEKEVLVYVKGDFDNSIPFITTAYINSDGDWQSDYDGEVIDSKITHWMPLPEPPEND